VYDLNKIEYVSRYVSRAICITIAQNSYSVIVTRNRLSSNHCVKTIDIESVHEIDSVQIVVPKRLISTRCRMVLTIPKLSISECQKSYRIIEANM